jgi:hypothetical protein
MIKKSVYFMWELSIIARIFKKSIGHILGNRLAKEKDHQIWVKQKGPLYGESSAVVVVGTFYLVKAMTISSSKS